MLRISAKLDYGLRALTALAEARPHALTASALAARERLPLRFLSVTLAQLRAAGLVHSRRGSDGGFWLALDPHDVTLGDLMVALEGSIVDSRAVPGDDPRDRSTQVWSEVGDVVAEVLESVTLADVVARSRPATPQGAAPVPPPG